MKLAKDKLEFERNNKLNSNAKTIFFMIKGNKKNMSKQCMFEILQFFKKLRIKLFQHLL